MPPISAAGPIELPPYLAREFLLGGCLGLGVGVIVAAWGLIAPAEVGFDDHGEGGPIPGDTHHRWLVMIALSVFVCCGGHRGVLRVLLDTFRDMPPGAVQLLADTGEASSGSAGAISEGLARLLATSTRFALRASQPYLLVSLGAWLLSAVVTRHASFWAHVPLGALLRALGCLGVLFMTLGGLLRIFEGQVDPIMDRFREAAAVWGTSAP